MVRLLAAFMVAACVSSQCYSSPVYYDGNALKQVLDQWARRDAGGAYSQLDAGIALGYVIGVADTISGTSYCVPPKAPANQLLAVVYKYLQEHPAEWSMSGDQVVAAALSQAFPCPKKK